ncbi:DNA-dependent protein kinase catalytic subunit, putative, partial [Bodo saltans]
MSMMIKASATIVREIGCDLALAHQSSSDPHAASLGTTLQLIENVAQHVVNFFAIAPAAEFKQSDEDDPERLAFLHATDGLLYEVLSTPASLLELSRKLSSTADSIVATASSQESKCLKETFSGLCVVVELASGRITVKQFAQLRRCAYDTFARLSRTNTHHAVQTEAIKLLTMVVEAGAGGSSPRLPAAEVDFGRTLEAIERCTARTTGGQGARGGALRLLGTLANAYPAEAVAFLGQILQTFRRSMEDMIAKSEPDQLAGEGVMLGLTALLHHFGSHEATEAALGSLMFPFVRGALHVTLDPQQTAQQRYRFTKATLKFLKYHAMYMRVALHGEAVTMFRVLRSLCGHKNVDLHKEAYPAAMSFLEAYAFTACHQSPPAQPSLLPQLIQMAKESLLRVDVEPYELSIAVSSFGALARPMAQLLTPVEMVEVFRELSGKSQALLEASEAEMESATRYLPQFLSTYAAIIYEIVPDALIHSSHGQAVMNAVEQLVDSVLLLFPRQYYFPKQRAATPLALMKLFLACTRHPVVLGRVCTRFVERGLTLSIGSSSMFRETVTSSGSHTLQRLDTLDADRVDTAPPIPSDQQEGALYDEYMPLWHGLLTINTDVAKWSYPWKESLRDEEVMSHCHAIRWELMRCISQSIKVLDLHCTTQAAPNVSGVQPDHSALGAGGASISPRNPKDYSLFLCLVPFFSKVALALFDTACGDDELLVNTGEWGLVLARACIDRSCLWPHVSGYYTIVESLLTALPKEVLKRQGDLSAALLNFHEVAIRRIPDCSRELLFACVSCLAAYPAPQLITVDQLAAPLKTLLQLGLEYEPAATRAIQTLSTVLDPHRANEVPTSLLSSVLPFLTSYVAQQNNQLEDVTRSHIAQRATELIGHAGLRLASAMEDPHVDDDLTTQMHALQLDPDHTLRLVLPFR